MQDKGRHQQHKLGLGAANRVGSKRISNQGDVLQQRYALVGLAEIIVHQTTQHMGCAVDERDLGGKTAVENGRASNGAAAFPGLFGNFLRNLKIHPVIAVNGWLDTEYHAGLAILNRLQDLGTAAGLYVRGRLGGNDRYVCPNLYARGYTALSRQLGPRNNIDLIIRGKSIKRRP